MSIQKIFLAIGLAVSVAACGDSPPADLPPSPAASNEVPASATASVATYAQFTGSLVKTETGQPLDVNKVLPPTSESAEPVPVL